MDSPFCTSIVHVRKTQLIPAGELSMVPLPLPASCTVIFFFGTNRTVMLLLASMVAVHCVGLEM
jgi:hypothetical protein